MCLGEQARNANKTAKRQYKYQLAQRERNWMNTLALTNVERVQHEQTMDASHVGLANAYAEIQEKYRDQIGKALQQDEVDWKEYLSKGEGQRLAASGVTGRSAERIASRDLASYLAKGSRKAYELTHMRRELSKAGGQAAGKARQMQLQSFAKNNIVKSPDLQPPKPVFQNVAMAQFKEALGIASQVATIATPFIPAPTGSSKKLKDNIVKIGRSIAGHNIYKFNYKGDSRRYVGVIAEEIQQTVPEAVVTMPSGFLGVIYDLIDVNFHEVPA